MLALEKIGQSNKDALCIISYNCMGIYNDLKSISV